MSNDWIFGSTTPNTPDTYPFLVTWVADTDDGCIIGETELFLSRSAVDGIVEDHDCDLFDETLSEAFCDYVNDLGDDSPVTGTEIKQSFSKEGFVTNGMILAWLDMAEIDDYEPLSKAAEEEVWNRLGFTKLKQPRFRY